jgi:DnaJ like chaperone protein
MTVAPGPEDTWDIETDFERFLGAPEHAWRTGGEPAPQPVRAPAETGSDPYAVLRVPKDAAWEDILTAYRRQVRWWHPDGLGEASETERAACEDRIRVLNAAYSELRVRRGR